VFLTKKTKDNFSVNKYIFWSEGIYYRQERGIFLSLWRLDRLWGPYSLLINGIEAKVVEA
jgi:hypothetical protein